MYGVVMGNLLPVDLDIVHPETGELDESKEDIDDGGYVSIKRMADDGAGGEIDYAPITKTSSYTHTYSKNLSE